MTAAGGPTFVYREFRLASTLKNVVRTRRGAIVGAPPLVLHGQWKGSTAMAQPNHNDGTRSATEREASKVSAGAIASLLGGGLLLIFVFQNTQRIDLDFLFWTFTWPLWLLTIVAAVLGALVWFGAGVMRRHRRRKARREDRRG
jgi:uncharacterized integral membrane protein